MKKIARLTDLEIKIMRVLWEHDRSLTIQEIANYLSEDKLSVPSITQAMKHLVEKKAVLVSEHVLVSSVYARAFAPCYSQEEFLAAEFGRLQKSVFGFKRRNLAGIVASLLNNSDDGEIKTEEVEELQKIIDRKKNSR